MAWGGLLERTGKAGSNVEDRVEELAYFEEYEDYCEGLLCFLLSARNLIDCEV